jgi:hypothetical protein
MFFVRTLLMSAVVLWAALFCSRAHGAEEVDWGAWRVKVEEYWPGAQAGWDSEQTAAGIGLWRRSSGPGSAIVDYQEGWLAKREDGYGVVGMLEEELAMEERLEVVSFGRRDNEITLLMAVRPTGGVLPESVKGVVRRKMKLAEDSRVAVTFADARGVKLGGKKVLFAGAFPEDLPAGEYRVVVEAREEAGKIRQRYEKRLVRRAGEPDPLQGMSDERLLLEYIRRGAALKGTGVEPIDFPVGKSAAAWHYESPEHLAWDMTHHEIVRRGEQIVPALMRMLEAEAVRNPGEATHLTAKFGFAVDVMRMLVEIRDPRPLQLLVRVMLGMDGKANLPVREEAAKAAQRLTYMTFLVDRDNPATPFAMMGEAALIVSREDRQKGDADARLKTVAKLYTHWLAAEGKEPARWLALARQPARKAPDGNDPVAVRQAIAFLTEPLAGERHDDAPEETMRAIARIMERDDQTVVQENRSYIHLPSAIASYGPAARPYVGSMIEQARQRATWDSFANLVKVGGEQAMAYMVAALPELRDRVKRFGIDLDVDEAQMNDMEARQAVLAYRACRWGIERWAGRPFTNDQDIAEWWQRANGKTQREWLEQNLKRTAAEADAGNAKAQYIIRQVVPDLPHADADKPFNPPWKWRDGGPYREKAPMSFRERWLEGRRAELTYDETRSCFLTMRTE